MNEVLLCEVQGPIATLTINRAESRNPLGHEGDGEVFAAAASRINADRSIRAVILTGAGKAFSAGGDVKAMKDKGGAFAGPGVAIRERYRGGIHKIVRSVWNIEVPVIAAVNGPAIGLGNDVACLADMRLASDTAIFGATFLKIGLIPGDGGAWLLPRVIGMARASELLYTGDTIDAVTALQWGLVSRVVSSASLPEEAMKLAKKIAAQPPDVLRMTKKLLREGQSVSFDNIMELSAAMQALAHHTQDHAEAIDAFFEKRPGNYQGR